MARECLADVLVTALLDSAGRISGFVELTRDITERRRAEDQMQQVQKLESLGVLAGGVAHDFNNLLTGILGNCSIVMDDLPRGRSEMEGAPRRHARLCESCRVDAAAPLLRGHRASRNQVPRYFFPGRRNQRADPHVS